MTTLLLLMVIIFGFGGLLNAGNSSDLPDKSDFRPVMAGEYRDLTWFRKLKLGTAPYVNPRLLRTAVVVFQYRLKDFDGSMTPILVERMVKGDVAPAKRTDGYWDVETSKKFDASPGLKSWLAEMGISSDIREGEDVSFISHDKELLGAKPIGELVSWHAVHPTVDVDEQPPTSP